MLHAATAQQHGLMQVKINKTMEKEKKADTIQNTGTGTPACAGTSEASLFSGYRALMTGDPMMLHDDVDQSIRLISIQLFRWRGEICTISG